MQLVSDVTSRDTLVPERNGVRQRRIILLLKGVPMIRTLFLRVIGRGKCFMCRSRAWLWAYDRTIRIPVMIVGVKV